MAYLTLKDINKIYPNGYHAVHNFNLEIDKGEFIVFVGPSGCGKSTTLRMIAGLEDISNGDFLINGTRANDFGPREREVAMVFQSYALYPQMTVFDNIAFGLTLQGVDEEVIEEKVKKTAAILGLTDYLDRLPRALSGGQRASVRRAPSAGGRAAAPERAPPSSGHRRRCPGCWRPDFSVSSSQRSRTARDPTEPACGSLARPHTLSGFR